MDPGGFDKHRPGTRCCIHHPMGALHVAQRDGASLEDQMDIVAELLWDLPPKYAAPNEPIPF